MFFTTAKFIEFPEVFDPTYKTYDPAPVFKKRFSVARTPARACLRVCALGLGVVYLNGRPVTEDLFTAPVSDYRKTLWCTEYDVTALLQQGENEFCAILGNGFYNENLKTGWDFDTADWRGAPKLILECRITDAEGDYCIASDESWVCSKEDSPILFNQLRSGETYDCRIGEKFLTAESKAWPRAILSPCPPTGVFRLCECPPIRAFEKLAPVKIFENEGGWVVFDFGQNHSGYAEITLQGEAGGEVILRHSERITADGRLDHNGMDGFPFYQGPEFQTNRIILSGGVDRVVPRFTYHGFRYIEIEGATRKQIREIRSVFVHQAVEAVADLTCSDETVNQIITCARRSVWSNMFYALTDCPTREKLGWANDAVASAAQICTSFDSGRFFAKWLQDILDAQTPAGEIPSIIPTWGWGLEENTSCVGPLCSAVIFELPMAIYEATGDLSPLQLCYDAMVRQLNWLQKKEDENGMLAYGLGDWAGPFHYKHPPAPLAYVTTAQYVRLNALCLQTAKLLNKDTEDLSQRYHNSYDRFFAAYYDEQADRCLVDSQSAVAMMITLREGGPTEGLKAQLRERVLAKDCHHNCGMVSLRHLYKALELCGLHRLAYQIVTADGSPSYKEWLEDGATTLYEMWNTEKSNNHHMNSCVVEWLYRVLLGIRPTAGQPEQLTLQPYFPSEMTFCKGHTAHAAVSWKRTEEDVSCSLRLPEGHTARVIPPEGFALIGRERLEAGEHELLFKKI